MRKMRAFIHKVLKDYKEFRQYKSKLTLSP